MEILFLVLALLGSVVVVGLGLRKILTKGYDREVFGRILDEVVLAVDLLKGDSTLEQRKAALKDLGKRLEEKDLKTELDEVIGTLGLSDKAE